MILVHFALFTLLIAPIFGFNNVFLLVFGIVFLETTWMVVHHLEGKQTNIRLYAHIQADIYLLTFKSYDYVVSFSFNIEPFTQSQSEYRIVRGVGHAIPE